MNPCNANSASGIQHDHSVWRCGIWAALYGAKPYASPAMNAASCRPVILRASRCAAIAAVGNDRRNTTLYVSTALAPAHWSGVEIGHKFKNVSDKANAPCAG